MSLAEEMAMKPTVEEVVAKAVAAERERCFRICEKIAEYEEGMGAYVAAHKIKHGDDDADHNAKLG